MSTLSFLDSIHLIRYLLVWRVNSSLVWLPICLSAELSSILSQIIVSRLPTNESRSWRKILEQDKNSPWPIEAVLFIYPGKRTYGQGELIVWELKLFGESADHGFFIEVILPAMEEAGYTSDPKWNRPNRLWGHFDIHAAYVARGANWEPLVQESRLNLRYAANPAQWAEGLNLDAEAKHIGEKPTRLTWLTSFDLSDVQDKNKSAGRARQAKASSKASDLKSILEALLLRMKTLKLSMDEETAIRSVMEQAEGVPVIHGDIKRAPRVCPGRWTGSQLFSYIPVPILPYLDLASILHVGRHTHLGCGTFSLIQSTSDVF